MSTTIRVGHAKHVILPVQFGAIKNSVRNGANLEIVLSNDQVLVLEGYFDDERNLLINPSNGALVQELTVSEEGAVTGISALSQGQVTELVGTQAATTLTSQVSDVLLFTEAPLFGGTASPYATEILVGTAALIGAGIWVADRTKKSADDDNSSNNAEASTTTDVNSTGVMKIASASSESENVVLEGIATTSTESKLDLTKTSDTTSTEAVSGNVVASNESFQSLSDGTLDLSSAQDSTWDLVSNNAFTSMFDKTLSLITLSSEDYATTLTLDQATLAKLSSGTITIAGDAKDSVQLVDQTDFTQSAETVTAKDESGAEQVYAQYTTTVESDTYTLLIDQDISVSYI